jgi:hypothetical protein
MQRKELYRKGGGVLASSVGLSWKGPLGVKCENSRAAGLPFFVSSPMQACLGQWLNGTKTKRCSSVTCHCIWSTSHFDYCSGVFHYTMWYRPDADEIGYGMLLLLIYMGSEVLLTR